MNSLKSKCSKINQKICNLEDIISTISASTQIQEAKEESIYNFINDVDAFSTEVDQIDSDVADLINKNKNDFYDEYHYLKPDSEKSDWEEFWEDAGEWCAENWKNICNIVLAIAAVVVGVVGQLVCDVVSWAVTGKWTGTWESYLGAALGGVAGGILMITCNPILACTVESSISTLFSESLESLTGTEKRDSSEVWLDTVISAGTAALCSKIFDKASKKLGKFLSGKFNICSRLSGTHSYGADFQREITKLLNGNSTKFSWKTIRNGVVDGLFGGVLQNIANGFGLGDLIENSIKELPKNITLIEPILPINLLPIKVY